MFSIHDELERLRPAELDGEDPRASPESMVAQWEEAVRAITRLGKQQFRSNQAAELMREQTREALDRLREHDDVRRRELERLRRDARAVRLAALSIVDALDDLTIMARQRDDPRWLERLERLTACALGALAEMGLSEVPAAACAFDERVHEAVDSVGGDGREQWQVVEVLRRGFRFDGEVLRRAQVVTTR